MENECLFNLRGAGEISELACVVSAAMQIQCGCMTRTGKEPEGGWAGEKKAFDEMCKVLRLWLDFAF